jgi:hypothetical protein
MNGRHEIVADTRKIGKGKFHPIIDHEGGEEV